MSSTSPVTASPTANAATSATQIEFIDSAEFDYLDDNPAELALVRELTTAAGPIEPSGSRHALLGSLMRTALPPLTAGEERMLFRRMNYTKCQAEAIRSTLSATKPSQKKLVKIQRLVEEADQICRRIVESNIPLVVSIARKYSKSQQEFQEFVSDGLLILLGAIRKFDYSRGFRFSTYATHSVQRYYFRATQRTQRYSQRHVLTPADVMADVAGDVDEQPEGEQDAAEIYRRLMKSAEGRLNAREEAILHRRFGTGGHGVTQTLREVAADLGISKERVRQIQMAALAKLQTVAAEMNLIPSVG